MSGLRLPALTTLLARARAERFPAVPYEGWLCQAFQVERQHDWPVAPFTLAIDGGEIADSYWLRADPAHLKIGRDRLVMIESALFDLRADEAQAMVSSLNTHFAGRELAFFAPAPKRWYAKVPRTPELVTFCASEVAGRDVQSFLPTGRDALQWHGIFNEVQMLLYAHAANADREERGEPIVNSVWLWGGGVQAQIHGRPYDRVWSNDALAVALAVTADVPGTGCPADAASWLSTPDAQAAAGSHLVVLDELAAESAHQDAVTWRERIASLETRWFAPLLDALREGRVTSIAMVVPGEANCWRFELARRDLLKFWRRAKPWTEYA